MAHIVFADDGIVFDGTTPEKGPLGGAESALICLAETLAARGHRVSVKTVFQACSVQLVLQLGIGRRGSELYVGGGHQIEGETRQAGAVTADTASQLLAALQHADSGAAPGQQRSADQGIQTAADNDIVKLSHLPPHPAGLPKPAHCAGSRRAC